MAFVARTDGAIEANHLGRTCHDLNLGDSAWKLGKPCFYHTILGVGYLLCFSRYDSQYQTLSLLALLNCDVLLMKGGPLAPSKT